MNKRIPTYLLDKYLEGDCTSGEEKQVIEWYNSFNDNADWISLASDAERQEIKQRIYSAIVANSQGLDANDNTGNKKNPRYLFYTISSIGIAATLLICTGLYFLHRVPRKASPPVADMVTVTNNTKTINEQILSDGTHVWLSPGAQLKYKKIFAGNTREVTMTGESFFEVTKNPARPFIINSGKIITKVWGTSFRVRNLKGSSFADVAVVTGKVSVKLARPGKQHNAVSEVMIYPNQQVSYVSNENSLKTGHKTAIKELKIWQKINLSFDNTGLINVIAVLNKNFGVNISTADDGIKAYTLNADFNGLNLPEIMEILHKTLSISYEINGEDISLKRS